MLDRPIGLNRQKVGGSAAIISLVDHTVIDLVRDRFEAVFGSLGFLLLGGLRDNRMLGEKMKNKCVLSISFGTLLP